MALVLPRLLAPVLPTTYSPRSLLSAKAYATHRHSESPYHTFMYCKGFALAILRRVRTLISVSSSGLPLSRPLLILGLVGHYPTNSLISRRLILRRNLWERVHSSIFLLSSISLSFSKVILDLRVDYLRVTELSAGASEEAPGLA